MVRWALYAGAGVGLLVLTLLIVGYLLPVAHVASVETDVERSPEDVLAAIVDVARYPEWRPDVSRVEVLTETPALKWKESGSHGDITFELELRTVREIKTRIADRSLPFGGTWSYEVTPVGKGTHLRVTEHGEVYNPLFRVLSRFVVGYTGTMEAYLRALKTRLGAAASSMPVASSTGVDSRG